MNRDKPGILSRVRIGLISDTHDQQHATARALKLLRDGGAELILHAGDVGGESIIDLLVGLNAHFVWGNTDWDRAALGRYAASLGVTCHDDIARLTLAEKRIILTHGDDGRLIRQVLAGRQADILITGHTHVPHDLVENNVRCINPGAVYRAARKQVALLDLPEGTLTALPLDC
jgi:putative phosphoesterase